MSFQSLFLSLLVRQYDSVGELVRALEKTYVINNKTKNDVSQMWVGLSQIRSLLPVQMSQEEEELMRERLWQVERIDLIIMIKDFGLEDRDCHSNATGKNPSFCILY